MMLIWLPWQSRGAGVSCAGGAAVMVNLEL